MTLAIIGQSTFIGAMVLGLLGALTDSEIGGVGAIAELAAIVVTIIAFFFLAPVHGKLWLAGAIVLIVGFAVALAAYAAIPGQGMFGKLGAVIVALGVLAASIAIAHLLAGLALVARGVHGLGLSVVLIEVAVLGFGLMAYFGQLGLTGYLSLGAALIGHLTLLVALISVRDDATGSPA